MLIFGINAQFDPFVRIISAVELIYGVLQKVADQRYVAVHRKVILFGIEKCILFEDQLYAKFTCLHKLADEKRGERRYRNTLTDIIDGLA